MVFKEENILFPTSLEKLNADEWVEILKESDEIGYAFIEKPAATDELVRKLQQTLCEEAIFQDGALELPTGTIRLEEVLPLLNTLPIDITFVDSEDTVRYFSQGKDRIFSRTKAVIGRQVDLDLWLATAEGEETVSSDVATGSPQRLSQGTALAAAEELVRRGLLTESDDASGYSFAHDTIRRVVYEGLSPAHRRRWHRRAGEALEEAHPERTEALRQEAQGHPVTQALLERCGATIERINTQADRE